MARMPVDVKDGFRYERMPWDRFCHPFGRGEDIPGILEQLRFADDEEATKRALGELWDMRHRHQTSASAPLAVPFLLRIAADRSTYWRAGCRWLPTWREVTTRITWWRYARTSSRVAYRDDDLRYDTNNYPQNWSIRAARDAVAADARILLDLLDDPEPDVCGGTCHVLSAASGKPREISIALHERLGVEDDPGVRARLAGPEWQPPGARPAPGPCRGRVQPRAVPGVGRRRSPAGSVGNDPAGRSRQIPVPADLGAGHRSGSGRAPPRGAAVRAINSAAWRTCAAWVAGDWVVMTSP